MEEMGRVEVTEGRWWVEETASLRSERSGAAKGLCLSAGEREEELGRTRCKSRGALMVL